MRILTTGGWVKAMILLAFLVVVGALIQWNSPEGSLFDERPVSTGIVGVVLFLVLLVHFYLNHPRNFANNARVLTVFGGIAVHLALLKLTFWMVERNGWLDAFGFLVFPYGLCVMALSVLLGRNLGLLAAVAATVFGCLLLDLKDVFPYLVTSLVCGFVAVFATQRVRRRSKLLRAGVLVGISGVLVCSLFGYVEMLVAGDVWATSWQTVVLRSMIPLLSGVLTGLFLGGILPILEQISQATTTISWIEMGDLNHPLLRRMTIEAPGTYHHSLLVANLAEAAADAIGANAAMCRVCSYFHDIGKLEKPGYFIENIGTADNPHDDLTPTMSALVIMAHVKDGVDLALKNRLNDTIIDVIEQHHGTSLVYYFYRKALDDRADTEAQSEAAGEPIAEEDLPEVSEKSFRYSGPKPQFRESAIVCLADAVESASRSLDKPTPQRITQLVEEIVRSRILDGQLDACDLTLEELALVRESLETTLRSMLHSRISYPKENGEEKKKRKRGKRGTSSTKLLKTSKK